nr:MAG TPA: hypothetical protein [Caudoviricetes sp.]
MGGVEVFLCAFFLSNQGNVHFFLVFLTQIALFSHCRDIYI